jgi:DNA-binding NarL/FixJ family response regulator
VPLSPRESQLVTMLTRGLKNKEICDELGLTEGTVKVYLSNLFRKSGAKDRFELALQGLKNLGMPGASSEGQGGLRFLLMEPA